VFKIDFIREKLTEVYVKITIDNKAGLFDINKIVEDIFMHILNDTYGWNLKNANLIKENFPAVDLIDDTNKIVIQVTSTIDTTKLKNTIDKFSKLDDYSEYKLKIFYIKDKPKFQKSSLDEFENKGIYKSDLLGIEDINKQVQTDKNVCNLVYQTMQKIFIDKSSSIPKQLTSKSGIDSIVGRKKELENINNILNSSESLLLINGIGGVGKSTVVSYYLNSKKDKLDYYGFFDGLDSFVSELREPLGLKEETFQDSFTEALSKLRKLEGEKLLVIDNVEDIEENKDAIESILMLKNSGYKILLTSREDIEDVTSYYLDVLSLNDAKELFNSIYKVEDKILLEEILEYLDYHAFFVEMTAKTLKSKKTLTPRMIKEKFENGKFSSIKRNRKESFNDYLNQLFSFDELDDEEILVLKQLSVLPSIEISFDNIQLFFDKENNSDFEDLLNYLSYKGWLIYLDGRYKLHQIIQEYIFNTHKLGFGDVENIFMFFNKLLSNPNINVLLYIKDNIPYLNSLLHAVLYFKFSNQSVVKLLGSLGYTYQRLGLYVNAKKSIEKALQTSEMLTIIDSDIKIIIYRHASEFYSVMENYDLALEFAEKGIEEAQKTWCNIEDIKVLELNLAKANALYGKGGRENFENAFRYYEGILKIHVLKNKNEDLFSAKVFNNVGNCCFRLEKYDAAGMSFRKAFKIYMDVYKNKHPDMVSICMNLAKVFSYEGENPDALEWYQNSLDMSISFWGENNLNTALIYYNFSKFYFKIENYGESLDYMRKAIIVQERLLPRNHTQLNNSIEGLRLIEEKVNTNKTKVGRNELCPCSSGKKYKKCCGKN
jgi:tetratricopeptide (TPR) repeat protein